MENVSKALLIAAGIMLSVMILSLLFIGYNQISAYYGDKSKITQAQQLSEFNSSFENYNRKNVRGSDLLSLVNKVIDYNEREVYPTGKGYERMIITINLGSSSIISQLKYNNTTGTNLFPQAVISNSVSNSNATVSVYQNADKGVKAIANAEQKSIEIAGNAGISLDSEKLQKLTSNISNIMDDNSVKRSLIFRNVLKRDDLNTTELQAIKNSTCTYYQYMQFKRAYFNCTNFEYDEDTGRVCKIEYEISVKDGLVQFN